MRFTYITTQDELLKASKEWKKQVGVDLECENNLHHYGSYISLIQISTEDKHFIVDVLALEKIQPVLELLRDETVEKIFHDIGFDLRILHHQFHVRTKNIFDTFIAAHLLGKRQVGLGSLLKEYFGIEKKSKFQMADWTKRPLKDDMLNYAIKDTVYLIRLRDKLKEELREKGRLEWLQEEFSNLEKKEWSYKEQSFWDLRGLKDLTDNERSILKELYILRDKLARKVNRPVHFIMNAKKLTTLAKDPPASIDGWMRLRQVHPVVKKEAKALYEAVQEGRNGKVPFPFKERLWFTPKQRKKAEELNVARERIAKRLEIERHLVINKEQIQDTVTTGRMESLREWQKIIIKKRITCNPCNYRRQASKAQLRGTMRSTS